MLLLKVMSIWIQFFTCLLPTTPGPGKVQGEAQAFHLQVPCCRYTIGTSWTFPEEGLVGWGCCLWSLHIQPWLSKLSVHQNPCSPPPSWSAQSAGLGGVVTTCMFNKIHRPDTETHPASVSPRPRAHLASFPFQPCTQGMGQARSLWGYTVLSDVYHLLNGLLRHNSTLGEVCYN